MDAGDLSTSVKGLKFSKHTASWCNGMYIILSVMLHRCAFLSSKLFSFINSKVVPV